MARNLLLEHLLLTAVSCHTSEEILLE